MTCASHRVLLLTDVSLAMRSDEGLIVWMRDIFHQSGLSDLRRTGPQDQIPSCGATLREVELQEIVKWFLGYKIKFN